jgi:acetoacetate decarboxylase
MSKKGKMTFGQFGYTMPVHDAIVKEPPYYYRNIESMCITYETDYESVAQITPAELEFTQENPIVQVMISNFPFSTFGPYYEVDICINVLYQGKPYAYVPSLYVTQEAPLIGGREIWGYAKKLAHIELRKEREQIIGILERPEGNRFFTAVMRPERNVEAKVWNDAALDLLSIKHIPSAEPGKPPEVSQLIATKYRLFPKVDTDGITELWSGTGGIEFHNTLPMDTLHMAPVKKVLDCTYGWFNNYLPHGKIIYDYLKG